MRAEVRARHGEDRALREGGTETRPYEDIRDISRGSAAL
jgi:hypothetical protein